MKRSIATLLTFLLATAPVPLVFADTATSIDFSTHNTSVNDFGGSSTSTNFTTVMDGGEVSTGESTSTNFTLQAGTAYVDSVSYASKNWRWYDDETSETPTLALASENVAPSNIDTGNILKLRITVKNTSTLATQGVKFKLQYSTLSDFSDGGTDVTATSTCAGNSAWCYADGAGIDNALISSSTLSDADSCVLSVGSGCGTHNESGTSIGTNSQAASTSAEYEYTIVGQNPLPGTVYFFRLYDVGNATAVSLNAGAAYPSLVTGGGSLTFSINGLPSATSTAGVTTTIDTSPTAVDFGTLPIGTSEIGAHRLAVSTSAINGYEIYTYERQGFLGDRGGAIPGVSGTNASPSGWNTGCSTGAQGCFGYHSTADVLAGNSTRFAAPDSYASFTSQPAEVAYSAGSQLATSTEDIVYRVEAHNTQDASSYSTQLVYIIVPVF